MTKEMRFVVLVLFIVVVFLAVFRGISGEDDWICSGGQWVKHGNPSSPMPQEECR